MKKISLVILLILIIATGCTANNYAEPPAEDLKGAEIRTNPTGQMSKSEILNEQSPTVLNINGRRTNNHDDINKARNVVDRTDEFRSGSVWIEGNHMWVTVYKKGMMNETEKIDAEANVHRKLSVALPDYDLEVRVLEDRS